MENNLVRTAELLGGKKNIVGGSNADLILETLGKIYIKSGKKTQLLNDVFKLLDLIDINSGGSKIIITLDLSNLKYPGDGYLIFDTSENSLYIAYDMRYLLVVDKIDPFLTESPYIKKKGDTMTGQLKITHRGAPLVVASKELVKNFNANYFLGHDTDYFAVKELDELIYGSWSFDKNTLFMENVDVLGNETVGGNLDVNNNSIIGGNSSVYGNELINKNLTVFGQAEVKDNAHFRKNVVVNGDIITDGSIGSPMFMSGYNGYGWRFEAATNTLTVDYLVVRKAMHVFELVVNQISATNGSLWVTDSGEIDEVFDVNLLPLDENKKTKLIEIPKYYSKYVEEVVDGVTVGSYLYVEYIPTHSKNKLLCDYKYTPNLYSLATQGEESAKYAKVLTGIYFDPTISTNSNYKKASSEYSESYSGHNLLKGTSLLSLVSLHGGDFLSGYFLYHRCWYSWKPNSTGSVKLKFSEISDIKPATSYVLSFWIRGVASADLAVAFKLKGSDNGANVIDINLNIYVDGNISNAFTNDCVYFKPSSTEWSRHYIKFKTLEDLSAFTTFELEIVHLNGEIMFAIPQLEEKELTAWSFHKSEFPSTNLNLLENTNQYNQNVWEIKKGDVVGNTLTYTSTQEENFLKQTVQINEGWYCIAFESKGLGTLIVNTYTLLSDILIVDGKYTTYSSTRGKVPFTLYDYFTTHTILFYSNVSTEIDFDTLISAGSTVSIRNIKLEKGTIPTRYYVSYQDRFTLDQTIGIKLVKYSNSDSGNDSFTQASDNPNKIVGKYLTTCVSYRNGLDLYQSIFIENASTPIPTFSEEFIRTSYEPTHIKDYTKLVEGDVYESNALYFAFNKETKQYEEAVTKYFGEKEIVATHIKDGETYREPTTKDGAWYIPYIANTYNHKTETINTSCLVSSTVSSETAFTDEEFNLFKYICKFKSKEDLVLMSPDSSELDVTNTEYIDKVGVIFRNSEFTELTHFWQDAEYEEVDTGGTHIRVTDYNGTHFEKVDEGGTHVLKAGTDQYVEASGTNVATHLPYGTDSQGNTRYVTLEEYNVLNPVISNNLMLNTAYTARTYVIPTTEPFNDSSRIYEMFQYYKYFGNKSLSVDNIKVIKMKEDKIPPFKEGDLVRCLKYQDGNIKYYDALIMSKIGGYEYIIVTAESVFDKQTTVTYNEDGSVADYKVELNKSQYEKTSQNKDGTATYGLSDLNNEDFEEEELIAGVAAGDGIVRIGHMYDTDRQNSVYITSSELDSPYIQTMSGVSRPDYSVLYSLPEFKINDRGWFLFSVGSFPIVEEIVNDTWNGQIRVRSHKGWDWCKVTTNDKGEKFFYYNSHYCLIPDTNNVLQVHMANYDYKVKINANVRTRLGNLNGIVDPLFTTKQPYGYGLFADNVFLKGEFYLNNGQTVVEFSKEQALIESKKITLGAIGGSLDNIFANSDYDNKEVWQERGTQYEIHTDTNGKFINYNGERLYSEMDGTYTIGGVSYTPSNNVVEVITEHVLEETDDYKFIYLKGAIIEQKARKSVITDGPVTVEINVDLVKNYSAVLKVVDENNQVLSETPKQTLEIGIIKREFDVIVEEAKHRLVLVITPIQPSVEEGDTYISFKNEFTSQSAINSAYIKVLPESITQTVKGEFNDQFTQIKQDMNSISNTVSAVDGRVTELKQTVDSFKFEFNKHNLFDNWEDEKVWYYIDWEGMRMSYTPTKPESGGYKFTPDTNKYDLVRTGDGNYILNGSKESIVVETENPLPQLMMDSSEDVYLEKGQKLLVSFDFNKTLPENMQFENMQLVLLSESLKVVGTLVISEYEYEKDIHISSEIELSETVSGILTLGIVGKQPITIKSLMVGTDYSSFFEISSKGITSSFLEKGNILRDTQFKMYKNLLDGYSKEDESPWIHLNGVNGQTFTGQIVEETYKDSICIYGDSLVHPEKTYIELMKLAIPNKLKPCTWYTLSFWAKGDFIYDENNNLISSPGIYSYIYVSGKSVGDKSRDNHKSYTITDLWKRYSYTFKTVKNLNPALNISVLFRLPVVISDTCRYRNAYITMPQLEEGRSVGEWNPNEEDVNVLFLANTDGIKLALNETGINIDDREINLNAETTTINGLLSVNLKDDKCGFILKNIKDTKINSYVSITSNPYVEKSKKIFQRFNFGRLNTINVIERPDTPLLECDMSLYGNYFGAVTLDMLWDCYCGFNSENNFKYFIRLQLDPRASAKLCVEFEENIPILVGIEGRTNKDCYIKVELQDPAGNVYLITCDVKNSSNSDTIAFYSTPTYLMTNVNYDVKYLYIYTDSLYILGDLCLTAANSNTSLYGSSSFEILGSSYYKGWIANFLSNDEMSFTEGIFKVKSSGAGFVCDSGISKQITHDCDGVIYEQALNALNNYVYSNNIKNVEFINVGNCYNMMFISQYEEESFNYLVEDIRGKTFEIVNSQASNIIINIYKKLRNFNNSPTAAGYNITNVLLESITLSPKKMLRIIEGGSSGVFMKLIFNLE